MMINNIAETTLKRFKQPLKKGPLLQFLALLSAIIVAGCDSTSPPVKLGFMGGTSGRVADLGVAGRNGFMLAVEHQNKAGGIDGKMVELILKDDKQDPAQAKENVRDLINTGVDAIIGPMTSAMAMASVDIANQTKTLMMGVTVTTNQLTNIDDYFFRTLSPTKEHASVTAEFLAVQKKVKRVSAIYDLKNKAYTESWLNDFTSTFMAKGGRLNQKVPFESGDDFTFENIAKELLKYESDAIVLVVNSVDAALLAKHIRSINPEQILATSEWAGTERLVQLGGKYVENTVVPQYLDRESKNPTYIKFRDAYFNRFNQEPGYPGLIAYNATNAVMSALQTNRNKHQLKETLLNIRTFEGVVGKIQFNQYGDAPSKTYITEIVNGEFKLYKPD